MEEQWHFINIVSSSEAIIPGFGCFKLIFQHMIEGLCVLPLTLWEGNVISNVVNTCVRRRCAGNNLADSASNSRGAMNMYNIQRAAL